MKTMLKKRIFPALLLVCLLLAVSCACAMGEECAHVYDADQWQHNETWHWRVCTKCGEELSRGSHSISCETGLCVYCGQEGEGDTAHNWDEKNWKCIGISAKIAERQTLQGSTAFPA